MIRTALSITDSRFEVVELTRRPDGGPVRLGFGRRARSAGTFVSAKCGTSMPWESRPELHGIYEAEVDTAVVAYAVQPESLSWYFEGEPQRYTPDRSDLMEDGGVRVIEIKDVYDADQRRPYARKLDQVARIYSALGRRFEIHDIAKRRMEPRFDAIEEVQAYRRSMITVEQVSCIRRALGQGPLPMEQALDALGRARPRAVLCAMMVRRIVEIDLSTGLHARAAVSLVRSLS